MKKMTLDNKKSAVRGELRLADYVFWFYLLGSKEFFLST
jgi:hypothetical protein